MTWQDMEVAPKDRPIDIWARPIRERAETHGTILPQCQWVRPTNPLRFHAYGSHLAPRSQAGYWQGLPEGYHPIGWRHPAPEAA